MHFNMAIMETDNVTKHFDKIHLKNMFTSNSITMICEDFSFRVDGRKI